MYRVVHQWSQHASGGGGGESMCTEFVLYSERNDELKTDCKSRLSRTTVRRGTNLQDGSLP